MNNISLFGVVSTAEMETISLEVMRSGRIASGEYVEKFEKKFSKLIGMASAVSTVDMTSAMELALYLSGVTAGDEVLTTAFACMATNSPIAVLGAIPVWVDVLPNSVCIDPVLFEKSITPKTKAAILYHVAGYPSQAKKISEICKRYGIFLIEDCNNALLAKIDEKLVGSFGDFSIYSFYPNRQINTTEGGVLICNDQSITNRAKKLRRFGIDSSSFRTDFGEINPESDISEVGRGITLNNLCAALGCTQLDSVESKISKARYNASLLISELSNISGINIIQPSINSNPAYWVFLVQVEQRDNVIKAMKTSGIHVSSLHHRNDVYSCFQSRNKVAMPNTNDLQQNILAIPCGWWLSENDINHIAATLINTVKYRL